MSKESVPGNEWRDLIASELRRFLAREEVTEPIRENDLVIDFFEECGGISPPDAWLDVDQIESRIANHFGLVDRTDWFVLWGKENELAIWDRSMTKDLRFADLIDFLAVHLYPHPIAETVILGRKCKSAASFRLIEFVVMQVVGVRKRFRPSDRIDEVIGHSQVAKFWAQLNWRSGGTLPKLIPEWWLGVSFVGMCIAFFVIGAKITAVIKLDLLAASNWVLISIIFWLCWIPLGALVTVRVCRFCQPATIRARLPERISTFRDLAISLTSYQFVD